MVRQATRAPSDRSGADTPRMGDREIPRGYRSLPGSERPQVPDSHYLEDLELAEPIGFTIRVRSRPGAPAEHDLDHWQNTPARRRHFLSAEEHMRRHGAAAEDVDAVVAFLRSHDLRVIEADPGRRRIVVEGTAANINAAFAITLKRFRAPQRHLPRPTPKLNRPEEARVTIREHQHRGYDGPVHLPADLVGVITAVIGLDNRMVGAPAATGTGDPPSSNYLSPEIVGQTYNFPNTGAVGRTVGIFEDAASGAAYLHSDITSFINSLPVGFRTQPVLRDIGLTIGGTTYSNNSALVTTSPTPAVGECCVDVSIVAAIVQGGNINVYFTENSEAGWEAFLNRAIFPLPGDNAPSVLSASWLMSFGDDVGSIGDPTVSGSIAHVISGLLQTAAARGITVFMAIGDWGSANEILDGKCHVSYPNCDPWSTACGGTILGAIASSPTRFQEFVWSDANIAASPFQSFPFVSTGGGVSDNFPTPIYQTAAGVMPISNNDGNARRGAPDVAGMIGMDGFFFAGAGGPGQYGFIGTSLVAPLYAGLVAVIVKWLGRDVGFLNPLFYSEGPSICNDVRFGDNEFWKPVARRARLYRRAGVGCLYGLGQHRRLPPARCALSGADPRHRDRRQRRLRGRLHRSLCRRNSHDQQHRLQPALDFRHHLVVVGLPHSVRRVVSARDRTRRINGHRNPFPADRAGPGRRHVDHPQQ